MSFALGWDLEGATLLEEGGLRVENGLGFVFHVQSGFLISQGASLVHCHPGETTAKLGWRDALRSLWRPSVAHAGHGDTPDPSSIAGPWVESLTQPTSLALGRRQFQPQHYCQAHYVIGPAPEGLEVPGATATAGTSFFLMGRVSGPGAFEAPLELRAAYATGQLLALPGVGNDDPQRAEIQLVRSLGTLFEEVDPSTMDSAEMTLQVMLNLAEHVRLEASLQSP